MSERTIATRGVWAASYLLARGFTFLRAETITAGSAKFFFADPDDMGGAALKDFFDDPSIQRLIAARHRMAVAIGICRDRNVCHAADILQGV